MSRKATRRAERAVSLRRRLLAGATTVIIGLGLAVGGTMPATAAPSTNLDELTVVVDEGGQKTYSANGLVCNDASLGFTKTTEGSLPDSGTFEAEWGSLTWNNDDAVREVSWSIKEGWDVDICVKGGIYLTALDTSVFTETPYSHNQFNRGLSHLGFRVVEQPDDGPSFSFDCVSVTVDYDRALVNGDHITIDVYLDDSTTKTRLHAYVDRNIEGGYDGLGLRVQQKFADGSSADRATIPLTQADIESGVIVFEYPTYFTADYFAVSWIQMNEMHFNQDEQGEWYTCGEPDDQGPECVTVVWQMYGWDTQTRPVFDPAQTFYAVYERPCYVVDVSVPTDCDTYWQIDSYLDNDITQQLIDGGTLTAPGEPNPESFPPNHTGWGGERQIWRLVANDACTTPTATPTAENCLDGDGTITFGDVDGIASYAVDTIDGTFAPGETLTGLEAGTYSVTAIPDDDFALTEDSSPFDVVVASSTENCSVATASVTLPDPDCEFGQSWDDVTLTSDNASFGTPTFSGDNYTIVATADEGFVFDDGTKTATFTDELLPADESACAVELEPIPVRAVCDDTTSSASFTLPDIDGVTWFVDGEERSATTYPVYFADEFVITFEIDRDAEGGPFVLKDGALDSFTLTYGEGDVCEPPTSPIASASLAFTTPTCVEPQAFAVQNFSTTLAERVGEPTQNSDGSYSVVFTALDDAVFDQSPDAVPVNGVISDSGKTLTFTVTLAGPNEALCDVLEVVDPFDYVDNCLTASYTLFSAEGLNYWVTVNSQEPVLVTFEENEVSKTFPANPGDYVLATPVAEPGYVLAENQPDPLDRRFATYPNGCQLEELPNWPASATATDEVCTPFGVTSGSITVELSEGPSTNPTPVRYYIAHETAQEQELTSATTTVPAGSHIVTAVLTNPSDSLNNAGNEPVDFALTVGAADESDCDLPTLAITGASNAITGVGIGAVIIILAGMGFVLRRQLAN